MKASGGGIAASRRPAGEKRKTYGPYSSPMRKPPSGSNASDSASMLSRPFAACGRSGNPSAGRMPFSPGSSPVSGAPAGSVSRIVSLSVAITLFLGPARGAAEGGASAAEGSGRVVEAGGVMGGGGDIVAAIGQEVERAAVAVGRQPPGFRIGRQPGAGTERLAEPVAQVGGQASDADQSLVDVAKAADGD